MNDDVKARGSGPWAPLVAWSDRPTGTKKSRSMAMAMVMNGSQMVIKLVDSCLNHG